MNPGYYYSVYGIVRISYSGVTSFLTLPKYVKLYASTASLFISMYARSFRSVGSSSRLVVIFPKRSGVRREPIGIDKKRLVRYR